jgi:hypothetical protein
MRQLIKPTPAKAAKVLAFAEKNRPDGQSRVFHAPPGHRRLTINLSEDIHKKLKHAAVDQDTTATAIIEELLAKHL